MYIQHCYCCAAVDCLCDVCMKSCEVCDLLQYRVGSYIGRVYDA